MTEGPGTYQVIKTPLSNDEQILLYLDIMNRYAATLSATNASEFDGPLIRDKAARERMEQTIVDCVDRIFFLMQPEQPLGYLQTDGPAGKVPGFWDSINPSINNDPIQKHAEQLDALTNRNLNLIVNAIQIKNVAEMYPFIFLGEGKGYRKFYALPTGKFEAYFGESGYWSRDEILTFLCAENTGDYKIKLRTEVWPNETDSSDLLDNTIIDELRNLQLERKQANSDYQQGKLSNKEIDQKSADIERRDIQLRNKLLDRYGLADPHPRKNYNSPFTSDN